MGVLNLTPDSFSDGGKFNDPETALSRIQNLIDQGAEIIDIGGESTGPGAPDVSAEEELIRVTPIIDLIVKKNLLDKVYFSIDTYKSEVAEYALEKGFQMINDITALRGDLKMLNIILKYKPYLILMYSKDATPRTTKEMVEYEDVMVTVKSFLSECVATLLEAGFPQEKIILDPGMGAFVSGNPKYSFEIIERLAELTEMGYPILIGISRKSCLGGRLEDRDGPSAEWSMRAVQNGASIVRIHNVGLFAEHQKSPR